MRFPTKENRMSPTQTLLYCTLLSLTLRYLRINELLDQDICGLSVEIEGVFQRLKFWTLLQEVFLQPISSSMKILLKGKTERRGEKKALPPGPRRSAQLAALP